MVVVEFDEIVENRRPGFRVVVDGQVVADSFAEVEEHVPGVAGNAAEHVAVFVQEAKPTFKDWRLADGEDETPQDHGRFDR